MEIYKEIEQFEDYAVSNYGNVKNLKTNKILKPVNTPSGYLSCTLINRKHKKNFRIHRLVALMFLDNPQNKPYVNHINGIKVDNRVSNLEWCTAKENDTHARDTGLIKSNKPIKATCLTTGETTIFHSIGECSSFLGINKGSVHRVLSGKRKKCNDYIFEYILNSK